MSAESARDMRDRCVPDPAAVERAMAFLACEPSIDLVAIPMVFPGKTYGFWVAGQEVATVTWAMFGGLNATLGRVPQGTPSYAWARNAAVTAAWIEMGGRVGTVGWATVGRDGYASMFEDILSREDALHRKEQ